MGGEGDPLGIVREIEIRQCEHGVYAQFKIHPGGRDAQNSLGFWDTW